MELIISIKIVTFFLVLTLLLLSVGNQINSLPHNYLLLLDTNKLSTRTCEKFHGKKSINLSHPKWQKSYYTSNGLPRRTKNTENLFFATDSHNNSRRMVPEFTTIINQAEKSMNILFQSNNLRNKNQKMLFYENNFSEYPNYKLDFSDLSNILKCDGTRNLSNCQKLIRQEQSLTEFSIKELVDEEIVYLSWEVAENVVKFYLQFGINSYGFKDEHEVIPIGRALMQTKEKVDFSAESYTFYSTNIPGFYKFGPAFFLNDEESLYLEASICTSCTLDIALKCEHFLRTVFLDGKIIFPSARNKNLTSWQEIILFGRSDGPDSKYQNCTLEVTAKNLDFHENNNFWSLAYNGNGFQVVTRSSTPDSLPEVCKNASLTKLKCSMNDTKSLENRLGLTLNQNYSLTIFSSNKSYSYCYKTSTSVVIKPLFICMLITSIFNTLGQRHTFKAGVCQQLIIFVFARGKCF